MTQKQKFEVIKVIGDIEIRRYLPYVAAGVLVEADYEKAGNAGFRPLANYIFSNNISMTAPVIVEEKEKAWQVSFVMPDGSKKENLPTPSGDVKLRAESEEVCAVIRFSGVTNKNRVAKYEATLNKYLTDNQIESIGNMRIARFGPPCKPGFLRHNETVQPINYKN